MRILLIAVMGCGVGASGVSTGSVVQCDESRTTLELRQCLDREIATAEGRLAELDVSIRAQLSPQQVAPYENASRAWRLFRDLDCEREASLVEGGTMASVVALECVLQLTGERVEVLERFAADLAR